MADNNIYGEFKTEIVKPENIEKRSFEIILEELNQMGIKLPEKYDRSKLWYIRQEE